MSDTHYKEIELKYYADSIPLQEFTEFCIKRKPIKFLIASGYDHFYSNPKEPESFCRHRVGPDANQLTMKRKTTDANNFIRTEHNLDLTKGVNEGQVKALCKELGYEYNTTIFKNCFIYKYDFYILVYYLVYSVDMREIGRFVEIEMREDYAWNTEAEAWASLTDMERLCRPLGVTPQARVKRSLFEMFRS